MFSSPLTVLVEETPPALLRDRGGDKLVPMKALSTGGTVYHKDRCSESVVDGYQMSVTAIPKVCLLEFDQI